MTQPPSRETPKKTVSEILKHVDQLIKAGNIEESVREIIHAKEIDPRNAYVHAYEERLKYIREEHEKNQEKEKTRKEAEEAARLRDEELQERLEQERKQVFEERKRKEEEQKEQAAHDTLLRAQSGDGKNKKKDPGGQGNAGRGETNTHVIGGGGANERRPQPEHGTARAPRKGNRASDILIIDDDEDMLSVIAIVLADEGYEVTSLSTTDEALTLLKKKWKPDLILCDVDLKTSTMGGFTFYEKVQELEDLQDVPFVFLTGLADEIIMNRGKELGVDDYLLKPVSKQSLISTVKGKLKRYERLNRGKRGP